ncbi:MAG: hypothetical protein ABI599_04545 [Flavobacteriales bacterium]
MKTEVLNILELVNARCKRHEWLDAYITRADTEVLVISFSEDFCYYHNFSLRFVQPQFISVNSMWRVNTREQVLSLPTTEEARQLKLKTGAVKGGTIYKLIDEDGIEMFVNSASVELDDTLVQYPQASV